MPYNKNFNSGRRSGGNYHGGGRGRSFSQNRAPRRGGLKKDYIDPSRFVKVATPKEQTTYEAKHKFADFGLNQLLVRNLERKGFKTPSPIQDQAIPEILAGRDIIGIADTGTGKTAAFVVPAIQAIMNSNAKVLVVAPTRELAQQIDEEFYVLSKDSNLRRAVLIGGSGMGRQLSDLRRNPRVVIGTPGRIKDHIERRSLQLRDFNCVVLDEVDRMLDMGFVNDVRSILSNLSEKRQSLFFSATLDARVKSLIETFANNPVMISVKTGETGENIHQDVVRINGGRKIEHLHDLLTNQNIAKAIIFDDTQRSVESLSNELIARGFSADAIHGGKSQGQRQRSLKRFKDNQVTILVATDVAARGIDVIDVTHVINYSTPKTYDDYVHRIGRAGRAGKVGHALTFIER